MVEGADAQDKYIDKRAEYHYTEVRLHRSKTTMQAFLQRWEPSWPPAQSSGTLTVQHGSQTTRGSQGAAMSMMSVECDGARSRDAVIGCSDRFKMRGGNYYTVPTL